MVGSDQAKILHTQSLKPQWCGWLTGHTPRKRNLKVSLKPAFVMANPSNQRKTPASLNPKYGTMTSQTYIRLSPRRRPFFPPPVFNQVQRVGGKRHKPQKGERTEICCAVLAPPVKVESIRDCLSFGTKRQWMHTPAISCQPGHL